MKNRQQPDRKETDHGILYKPKGQGYQVLILLGALVAMLPASRIVSMMLGGLSDKAETFLLLPLFLIFMTGYGLWLTRLQAIAFHYLGKVLFRALLDRIIRRKKPENPEKLLPSFEKLEAMTVHAQRAAASFIVVSFPVAVIAGLASILFESTAPAWWRIAVVSGMCLLWGYALFWLGRRCYLPLPEEE